MRRLIYTFCVAFILFSCKENGQKEKATIVSNIPETAFWIAHNGKGHWFNIENINPHQNVTLISIYDGKTKKMILSKKFMKICPGNESKFIDDLQKEIDFYDGKRIKLKDNCYLQ